MIDVAYKRRYFDLLGNRRIVAVAPTRVDLGGGVDHDLIRIICDSEELMTFNLAINLYSKVTISKYEGNGVMVSGSSGNWLINSRYGNFTEEFGLVSAVVRHFDLEGLRIEIETGYPSKSGLGGSGSVMIALVLAISKLITLCDPLDNYTLDDCVLLAHSIENALLKNTGFQDQAVAMYGGVNAWRWTSETKGKVFTREKMDNSFLNFSDNSLLLYTGVPHYSRKGGGSKFVQAFIERGDGCMFVNKINENTKKFIQGYKGRDVEMIRDCLNIEEKLRREFVGYDIPENAERAIGVARDMGCGIKFTGGGGGGCLWVVGQPPKIESLKNTVSKIDGISILDVKGEKQGAKVIMVDD